MSPDHQAAYRAECEAEYREQAAANRASSAATVPEKGAAPLVGTGELVGLGSESVEKLLTNWEKMAAHWHTNALACEPDQQEIKDRCLTRWSIYAACAQDLRAEMESANQRQPQPNDELRNGDGIAATEPDNYSKK